MGFALFDAAFSDSPSYGDQAAKQEKARQAAIDQGTSDINNAFAGYNTDFYNQRAKAYQQFALPQLSQQYQQTRNQLMFNLANRGLLHSGAANTQWGQLQRTNAQDKQQIADTGISQSQDLQRQVEGQKSNLIGQLYQAADPASAAKQATATAASFTPPSTFTPLANMFGNIAQQYYLSGLINRNQPTSYIQSGGGSSDAGALPPVSQGY